MNNFSFYNPTKLIFGRETIARLGQEIPLESKVLITFGGGSVKKSGVYDQVMAALKGHHTVEFWGIEPNPSVETIREAVALGKEEQCNFVLAVGGGSVIDASKLIAAAILYQEDPWELVLISNYKGDSLPLGTVLTLPATGSEMNRGAVISNLATKEKFSFYSHWPKFSILDPTTTYTLPKYQRACGVADTFIHVIEQYLTKVDESPLMDRWSEGVLLTLIEIAPKVMSDQNEYLSMATFMISATMGLNGFIAMGVSQDWSTHRIGHELTALHGITHGHTLAIILPGTMDLLREEKGEKIVQYGKRVWGIEESDPEIAIDKAILKTEQFFRSLGLTTTLSENGVGRETILEIERRFNEREVQYGENGSVDGTMARKILERVL